MKYNFLNILLLLFISLMIFQSCENRPKSVLYNPEFVFDGPWQVEYVGYDVEISKLFFVNENIGWAFAPLRNPSSNWEWSGVLKTEDGGDTWTMNQMPDLNYLSFENSPFYVLDENNAWAILGYDKLYQTSNGENWQLVNTSAVNDWASSGVIELYFADVNNGWIVNENSIYKSVDKGYNWIKQYEIQPVSYGSIQQAYFYNENVGWTLSSRQTDDSTSITLFKTQDGGQNWSIISQLDTPLFGMTATDMVFTDDQNGWILYQANYEPYFTSIYKTTDGGLNWTELTLPVSEVKKMVFVNNDIGWIIGYYSLHKTSNGGDSWTLQTFTTLHAALSDIFFINENTGWIASYGPILLKTKTGGE